MKNPTLIGSTLCAAMAFHTACSITVSSMKKGDMYQLCRMTLQDGTSIGTDEKPCASVETNDPKRPDEITIQYNGGHTIRLKHCGDNNTRVGDFCYYRETTNDPNSTTIWYTIDKRER